MSRTKFVNDIEVPLVDVPLIEVYRIRPMIVGQAYETAECSMKTGSYSKNNERYFTTHPLQYVGKYVKHYQERQFDNADHWYIFDNNGVEISIKLSYCGNTCFREVSYKVDTI